MPFPGPIPDTPWQLMPPSTGVPYFRYVKPGTPSTYGDTADGGNAPTYDATRAFGVGAVTAGLMWYLSKQAKTPADVGDYVAAFASGFAAVKLYDTFGAPMVAKGPVEGLKSVFGEDPFKAAVILAVGIAIPTYLQVSAQSEYRARKAAR